MTKQEFRQAVRRNGLSCEEFARLVGRDVSSVYGFGCRYPVPYYARLILRLLDERGGAKGLICNKLGETRKKHGETRKK